MGQVTAILTALALKFWPYIVGAFGFLILVIQQRRAGAKAERAKQAEREAAARDIADQVDNDVGATPPDELRKELGRWAGK
jgi:hypothetical protein